MPSMRSYQRSVPILCRVSSSIPSVLSKDLTNFHPLTAEPRPNPLESHNFHTLRSQHSLVAAPRCTTLTVSTYPWPAAANVYATCPKAIVQRHIICVLILKTIRQGASNAVTITGSMCVKYSNDRETMSAHAAIPSLQYPSIPRFALL